MSTPQTHPTILSFSGQKGREPEVEAAAVFLVATTDRKSGGLLSRQPQEALAFIAKIGYPLWLIPKNSSVLLFDGLGATNHNLPYEVAPSANTFLQDLEANHRPKENYLSFLSERQGFFKQLPAQKSFALRGLIANPDFKSEFSSYRRETVELAESAALLPQILDSAAISLSLTELDKLQFELKVEQDNLSDCLHILEKTTSQYITEIEYETTAATEEANAKIKAQAEFINPQIGELKKTYSRKIKQATKSFDEEFDGLQKLKTKTEKLIKDIEAKIRQYEREAKVHGKAGHKIYEKRWKNKLKHAEKELSGLRKELKNIEENLKSVGKQKAVELSKLNSEWEDQVKLTRQPLVELETVRDAKTFTLKQERNRLQMLEKPIVEAIEQNRKLGEVITASFDDLGATDAQIERLILVYVPFYVVCYVYGSTRRYLCLPPSTVNPLDFSSKLKGALGLSKTKNLLAPRFKTIAALIDNVEVFARQSVPFESQLWALGGKNNLLRDNDFTINIKAGLGHLKNVGWLSEREETELRSRL